MEARYTPQRNTLFSSKVLSNKYQLQQILLGKSTYSSQWTGVFFPQSASLTFPSGKFELLSGPFGICKIITVPRITAHRHS